jgi:propionate CoA-transferase
MVRVPGILIDAIVIDEHQRLTTGIDHDPSASGELRTPWEVLQPEPLDGLKSMLVRRILLELQSGNVVNLGFGITSLLPQVALEEGILDQLTFTTEHGAIGGYPYSGIQFGGAVNPQALVEATSQFDFIDGGGPDVVCLSFAEMDREGNVNVTRLKELPHVTAGAGGFINLITHARKIIFCGTLTAGGLKVEVTPGRVRIVREGRIRKVVDQVQQITFNGRLARKRGQKVIYVTERGVFSLAPDGLVLKEIAPGVDLQKDIAAAIACQLRVDPNLGEMDPAIFRPGPMGLKRMKQWAP